MQKPFIRRKQIYYFPRIENAANVKNNLVLEGYPNARLVHYELGWAIQREKSGPYWGEPKSFGCPGWK